MKSSSKGKYRRNLRWRRCNQLTKFEAPSYNSFRDMLITSFQCQNLQRVHTDLYILHECTGLARAMLLEHTKGSQVCIDCTIQS